MSKPSLYRDFGSDDGFGQQIEALIAFTIQDRHPFGIPSGCLHVAMRADKEDLGAITRNKVDLPRSETLLNYERWIERAQSRGEFKADTSSEVAALFCDAQNDGAIRMQSEGVANEIIRQTIKLAFSSVV